MKVVIAEDHVLFREGLRSLLRTESIEVVGEAGDGSTAVQLARDLRPDIVLMDLGMPGMGGLEATRAISSELPEVRVVVVTASESDADLFEAIRSGAQGYVLKDLESGRFFELLHQVIDGEPVLSPQLARKVIEEFASPTPDHDSRSTDHLTEREKELLRLMVQGVTTTKELAERLVVSEHTVKYHLRNILAKLHLKSRAQVVAYATRYGIATAKEIPELDNTQHEDGC